MSLPQRAQVRLGWLAKKERRRRSNTGGNCVFDIGEREELLVQALTAVARSTTGSHRASPGRRWAARSPGPRVFAGRCGECGMLGGMSRTSPARDRHIHRAAVLHGP